MGTPEFVLDLRKVVGNAPLWMPGCTAIVTRPVPGAPQVPATNAAASPSSMEILIVRRADSGAWTPVTGIVDPGEEPARACEREVEEEAGVRARAIRALSIEVVGPVTYDNGDVTTYLDTAFLLEWVSGEPYPADGENSEALFVRADQLPEMNERFTRTIARALSGDVRTTFRQ